MPQLDSLRFFAVLGVLVTHYARPQLFPWMLGVLPWGALGVRLFFVLSGFLITGILLGCRELADATPQNVLLLIRQFYCRRFLRIFPVYYLVLAVVFTVNLHPGRQIWIWLVTYTSNVYISLHGHWIGNLGHFWTLSVEEQFYLFWPWLVLFAPRAWLVPMLTVGMALAPVYRWFAVGMFPADFASGIMTKGTFTLSCLDSLGAGALVAVISQSTNGREKVQRFLDRLVLPIGAIPFLGVLFLHYYKVDSRAYYILSDLFSTVVFCWLVSSASRGFKGLFGHLLRFKVLVYLGKITYGIYIFHNFTPSLLASIFGGFEGDYRGGSAARFTLCVAVTLGIASLSWHLVERPINSLKRHFEYDSSRIARPTDKEIGLAPSPPG